MKIAYIAPLEDGTGYSIMANDTILALDTIEDIDVVARPIKLATQTVPAPQRVQELIEGDLNGITHVIQHILPPYFSYKAGVKNIGFAHFETDCFWPSGWQHNCNLMDELWVSCQQNLEAARKSGVIKPIKIIPKAINPIYYNKSSYKLDLPIKHKYVFYHIGDYSSRKNTVNLIKCYLEEFSAKDNVVLILKTYVEGVPPQESNRLISEDINKIKMSLRKGTSDSYAPIILITDYLSNEQIFALHAIGNCFITLERGAAWNIPAHDAIAMGNWVIASGWGGQTEFLIESQHGNLLNYNMITVSDMIRCPYPSLYTAFEQWSDPCLQQTKQKMRKAFEFKAFITNKIKQEFIDNYSYQNIGKIIKTKLLN